MLSGPALDLAFLLRALIGPGVQNDGPDLAALRKKTPLTDAELDRALGELESVSFVHLAHSPEADGSEAVTTVVVLAPLQIYLEDLENQGTDDL